MDGLKGLPDAIKSVFPDVSIQNCIIHQIRNSIKYIASKDKKEFMKDLKCVYKAPTEDSAINGMDNLKKKWTSPSQNWGMTLAQLTIVFNDKLGEEIL